MSCPVAEMVVSRLEGSEVGIDDALIRKLDDPVRPAAGFQLVRAGMILNEPAHVLNDIERRLAAFVLHAENVKSRRRPEQHAFLPKIRKADEIAHDRQGQMPGEIRNRIEGPTCDQVGDQIIGDSLNPALNLGKGSWQQRRGHSASENTMPRFV